MAASGGYWKSGSFMSQGSTVESGVTMSSSKLREFNGKTYRHTVYKMGNEQRSLIELRRPGGQYSRVRNAQLLKEILRAFDD